MANAGYGYLLRYFVDISVSHAHSDVVVCIYSPLSVLLFNISHHHKYQYDNYHLNAI